MVARMLLGYVTMVPYIFVTMMNLFIKFNHKDLLTLTIDLI